MPIIKHIKDTFAPQEQYLNIFPNQFVDESKKRGDDFIKKNMDYFYTVALNRFAKNKHTFVRNYDFVKGIVRPEDFYMEDVRQFTDTLYAAEEVPIHVKRYQILASPINALIGEMSKRPDNFFLKATDDDSASEEINMKSGVLQDFIMQQAKQRIYMKLASEGVEPEEEQVTAMTSQEVQQYMVNYTSEGERWGNAMMESLKKQFNMKEKLEDGFRDLLITAHEYFHIYEDNSKIGFNVRCENPKNIWTLTTPDTRYTSDPLDYSNGAYAAGTIKVMEISEIIQIFNLPKEEIDHLYKLSQQAYLIDVRESNLFNHRNVGIDSVNYDVYDPAILNRRLLIESELKENTDELADFLGVTQGAGTFGHKFLVIQAYWASKKRVGKLEYMDADGVLQTELVDEQYKSGMHPGQVKLTWNWVNQWYQGYRIGPDVYDIKPLAILDYCPIIGVVYENKNIEPKSLVDLMKPYQTLHDICMNKLYESIQKDIGKVFLTSIRHVPVPKDGDYQDALSQWEMDARDRGIIFIDDSPENTKVPSSFNQYREIDLSRTNEMQGYYAMATQMRTECWELMGFTRQRLGSVSATETATGTQTAMAQSYAQTEPWFAQHEYLTNKLYQAILDAALYIQSTQPTSTIQTISSEGDQMFVRMNGSALKSVDLHLFFTSRSEDAKGLNDLRMLGQSMMQNGASAYDIAIINTTKSSRQIKASLKRLKDEMQANIDKQNELKQQELQQQQEQFQQAQQLAMAQKDKEMQNDNMNKAMDRASKERIAITSALGFGKVEGEDVNANSIPDAMEMSKISAAQAKAQQDYAIKLREIDQRQQEILNKNEMEKQKLEVKKQDIASKERIAKTNKNKYDK